MKVANERRFLSNMINLSNRRHLLQETPPVDMIHNISGKLSELITYLGPAASSKCK